jgi:hypothetical protein
VTIFEKEKRCSKCGLAFTCGGLLGCWCKSVKLDQAILLEIKKYSDCLCPSCLMDMALKHDPDDQSVTPSDL